MRYWAYLAGKVVAAAAPLYGLLLLLVSLFPAVPHKKDDYDALVAPLARGGQYLLCDLVLMAWFLLCAGALYLIVWDQRRRCRVCLHQLRMPIETGSRSYMLQLGQPRIESICPYGHGTLKEDELQISGRAPTEWTPNSDDIWEELCAPGKDTGQEP
jgi:hypothetical protein